MADADHTTSHAHISRRTMLVGTAVSAAALGTAAVAAASAATAHPDADLLAAWEGYKKWWLTIDDLPLDSAEEILAPYYVHQDHFRDLVESIPAKTADGLVIKLKYLFKSYTETRSGEFTIMKGHPCNPDDVDDYRQQMLWEMIAQVQQMAEIERLDGGLAHA